MSIYMNQLIMQINISAFIKNHTMIKFMWYNGQHDPNHIMQM
jgi:hypothetical protein